MTSPTSFLDTPITADFGPSRAWSEYQQAVFEAVSEPATPLLVQAVAGSGKTTTIIEAMNYAPGSSLFMAFNKSIAEDIRSKASSGDVKTLNALGHGLWRQNHPEAKLDTRKSEIILRKLLSGEDYKLYGYSLQRVVGLAKNSAFGVPPGHQDSVPTVFEEPAERFEELIDAYGFDIPADRIEYLSAVAAKALCISTSDLETFDFDDQLYMPAFWHRKYPIYSNVFVDECQDLSPIQHTMLYRLQERGARIVAVGDRHQAIYGFRGAMTNSMERLKNRFKMKELPLSISYRCPQLVILEAQVYCPTIYARPGAPIGVVNNLESDPPIYPTSLIVCRNNAPLFKSVLRHVRAKEPCRVLSNFLDSFQGFIHSFKCTESKDLQKKLDLWYKKETDASKDKGFRSKIEALRDKYETLSLFCAEFQSVAEIIDCVKRLATGNRGPTFATIHKAKGLEHERVFILRPDLLPSPWAESPEQVQQEENLLYVAITRSAGELTFGATI
jgi:superfamily I DNA/RNA helicase